MMSEKPIHIISVNVGCRSSAQYAVLSETLNHPLSYGIVFVQEPWWFNIGETSQPRSVAMNGWEPIPPQNPPPQNVIPRVHAYFRRNLNMKYTTRTDLINSPDIQIIDVTTNTATPKIIRFINVYNSVLGRLENPEINKLFTTDIDQTIPTILVGDWNVHHPSIGNMPPYAPNPNGPAIEWDIWMRDNSLTLRNLPDTPTRYDPISGRGYALDLTIVNNLALQERLVDNWEITDKLNGDSDHLATSFRLNTTSPLLSAEQQSLINWRKVPKTKFLKNLQEIRDAQQETFDTLFNALKEVPDHTQLDEAVRLLERTLQEYRGLRCLP